MTCSASATVTSSDGEHGPGGRHVSPPGFGDGVTVTVTVGVGVAGRARRQHGVARVGARRLDDDADQVERGEVDVRRDDRGAGLRARACRTDTTEPTGTPGT